MSPMAGLGLLVVGTLLVMGAWYLAVLVATTYEALRGTPHLFDPCLTPAQRQRDVVFVVKSFRRVMRDSPARWWLDYGNLLGAYRWGRMLPWDHDGDISFLAEDAPLIEAKKEEFAALGIELNMKRTALFYQGATVDVEPFLTLDGRLCHGDPRRRRGIRRLHDGWCDDFPRQQVEPFWQIEFEGELFPCPNEVGRFLRRRYPTFGLSRFIVFPHKLPCWLDLRFWKSALAVLRSGHVPRIEKRPPGLADP